MSVFDDRIYQTIRTHNGRWSGEFYHFRLKTPRARKDYICDGCGEPIEKGQKYVCYATIGMEGPGWETWHLHGECYIEDGLMFESERPDWRWMPRGDLA